MPQIVVEVKMKDLTSAGFQKMQKGAQQSTKKIKTSMGKVRDAIFSVKGALAGIGTLFAAKMVFSGALNLAKSFIRTAADAENMKVALEATLGSVEEANALFADLRLHATNVSNSLVELQQASVMFAGTMKGGRQEIMQWMDLTTDLAAITKGMGIDFQSTASQIMRMYNSGAAAADVFREKGVLSILGFQQGVKYSIEETREILMKAWKDPESKFAGAAKRMSQTWDGLMSMFTDAWDNFKLEIMDAGVFEALKVAAQTTLTVVKTVLKAISTELTKNLKAADLKKIVINLSLIIVDAVTEMIIAFEALRPQLEMLVFYTRLWAKQTIIATRAMNSSLAITRLGLQMLGIQAQSTGGAGAFMAQQMMFLNTQTKKTTVSTKDLIKALKSSKKALQDMLEEDTVDITPYEPVLKRLGGYYHLYKAAAEQGSEATKSLARRINLLSQTLRKAMGDEAFEKWREGLKIFKDLRANIGTLGKDPTQVKLDLEFDFTQESLDTLYTKLQNMAKKASTVMKDEGEMPAWFKALTSPEVPKAIDKVNSKIKSQTKLWNDATDSAKKQSPVLKEIKDALSQIGDFLVDKVLGVMDMIGQKQQDWRKWASEFLKDLAKIIVRLALQTALKAVGLAEGGTVEGGLGGRVPLKRYAAGGITDGPELAIIGEGKQDEAVIPLKHGAVPVHLKGMGKGYSVIFNVNAVDAKGVSQMLMENADTIKTLLFKFGEENPNVVSSFQGNY